MTPRPPLGRVLAVVSQKGGVGKTTTAVNLAAAFARRGLKTLIIDTDPQGAVRYGIGLRRGHATAGYADWLRGGVPLREVILPTQLPWLRALLVGSVSDEASHDDYVQRAMDPARLAEVVQVARERCQVVVLDTTPGLGGIVRTALAVSQHAIVPLQCEPLALQTTPQILRGLQEVAATNEELALEGILLTMYQAGNAACERTVAYVRQHMPANLVLDTIVPRTAAAAEAFAAGLPVVMREPGDAAAQAYVNLAMTLAERFGA